MSHIGRQYRHYDVSDTPVRQQKDEKGDGGFVVSRETSDLITKQCIKNTSSIRKLANS